MAIAEYPEAYLPGDRRRALATGRDIPDRAHGVVLFADISGFTALAEALVADFGRRRGAEELSATLETVFDAVLGELHRYAGSAIYFSGDAITCWLDGDDGTLGLACAFAMQQAMAAVGLVRIASGLEVRLAMRVTVAAGAARRFVVGDPDIQLIDVLAGSLMDEMADADAVGRPGEIVVLGRTADALGERAGFGERRRTPRGATAAIARTAPADVALPVQSDAVSLPAEVTRQWLLPAVYERLVAGNGEFLAELREVVPMFLHLSGHDYDDDPDAPAKLDRLIVAAQRIVDGYGGSVLQLTVGDKGAYVYATFGSPIAHEDNAQRACAAALELVALPELAGSSVGLARGTTRSGTYGHGRRRTFCCLGDPVNLAARMMGLAPPGSVYADEQVHDGAAHGFDWEPLPPVAVKGKAVPVPVFAVRGIARRTSPAVAVDRPMVGRTDALAELDATLAAARDGRGRLVGITADPGVGKSRLVAEFLARLPSDVTVALGTTQTFGVRTPYFAWREIVRTLAGMTDDLDAAGELAAFTAAIAALDPQLGARAPLLGAITGRELADNDLTAAMDAKLRKGSLELLVVQWLRRLSRRVGPVVIVVEDCASLDPVGAELLAVLGRSAADSPLLVIATYRPAPDTHEPEWLALVRSAEHARELRLDELEGADAEALIGSVFTAVFGASAVLADELRQEVLERTQGNPFHIEELATYLHTQGVDPSDPRALDAVEVPETLQSLVLSLIDTLGEDPRRTVKVASVVGRRFEVAALDGIQPDLGGLPAIGSALDVLTRRELVLPPSDSAVDTYEFRHLVVREVAYESLPFSLRARLHERAGSYLEAHHPGSVDLLAHHYWHGDNVERKQYWLRAAGDAARDGYANSTAIEHYERLLTVLPEAESGAVLMSLGQVRELAADWDGARNCVERAEELGRRAGDRTVVAWARTALAELARKRGEFEAAAELLQAAEDDFETLGDDTGIGRVLHLRGTLAGQQQQVSEARTYYERSLQIRRRLGDRAAESGLLANLGIMAEYEGDYRLAIELTRQALAVRAELGDRWAIGHAHSNLGMLLLYADEVPAAIVSLTEALRLHREVGDRWMMAIDLNNLANAQLRAGDLIAAAREFLDCLEVHRLVDDPWSAAHLLEDVAVLAVRSDQEPSALQLVGAADRLREGIGSPRSATQQGDQDALLGPVRERLGAEADTLLGAGRRLSIAQAFDRAVAVCAAVDAGPH